MFRSGMQHSQVMHKTRQLVHQKEGTPLDGVPWMYPYWYPLLMMSSGIIMDGSIPKHIAGNMIEILGM